MTTCAPSSFFASFDGCRLSSSSRVMSTKLGHARRRELLAGGQVGKKRVVDSRAELAALLDDAEAAEAPG